MNKIKKPLKKIIYHGRIKKFKQLIALMVIGGIVVSLLSFVRYTYQEYATAVSHIVLSYPKIAQSQYPDGSRFTYYDFVSKERIEEALKLMQKDGKYKNYTVEDLQDSFYVTSYLDASASNDVTLAQLGGNDFSYVANEYIITFKQPHDYGNPNPFRKLFSKNLSDDFLTALGKVNQKYISEVKSGKKGFDDITKLEDMSQYDYDEHAKVYKTKIKGIVAYLDTLEKVAPNFVSDEHNVSLKDLAGKYELLNDNQLDSIIDFIESSEISKNKEVAINKLKVNIENNTLRYNKFLSEAEISRYAMQNYDQTFTENLINVVRDKSQGLYQARPKTAFDSIVTQNSNAEEQVSYYKETIYNFEQKLSKYEKVPEEEKKTEDSETKTTQTKSEAEKPKELTAEEEKRLADKCDTLFANLDKEYKQITKIARDSVGECLNVANENYMTVEVKKENLFNGMIAGRLAFSFVLGALIMFVLCIAFSVLVNDAELKRKRKMLKKISEEKGE